MTIELVCADTINITGNGRQFTEIRKDLIGYPATSTRPNPPSEVSAEFADDYREAAAVLPVSPKASAALSRRCLQHVLREKGGGGVKRADLAKEIDEVLAANKLPPHLAQAIDAIRNIGNFAAHPVKSTASGTVVPVEPGEAEWTLDVLDGLFDFYFVQPAVLQQRRTQSSQRRASRPLSSARDARAPADRLESLAARAPRAMQRPSRWRAHLARR